jgi:hypothetical protein
MEPAMKILMKLPAIQRSLKILVLLLSLLYGHSVIAQGSPSLDSEFILSLSLTAGDQMNTGETLVAPITGGNFSGSGLEGRILPGGADWMTLSEGHNNLDVRITLETDDGEYIYMSYTGILKFADNPQDMYWTVAIEFQTASAEYDWLNHLVAVGKGRAENGMIIYDIFRII